MYQYQWVNKHNLLNQPINKALANFEVTYKGISGQSERLAAELKFIQRDENLASEKCKGLNAAIHDYAGE